MYFKTFPKLMGRKTLLTDSGTGNCNYYGENPSYKELKYDTGTIISP